MKIIATGEPNLYRFSIFSNLPEVQAFMCTRLSLAVESDNNNFNGKNLSDHISQPEKELYAWLNIPYKNIALVRQIHSNRIIYAQQPGSSGEGDGLVTDKENLYLRVISADCLPVFIFDPKTKSIGLVHAGWRGLYKNIAAQAIEKMRTQFNANPRDVRVAIGPFIRQCCYTVRDDVGSKFAPEFLQYMNNGEYKLDLEKVVLHQLTFSEVPRENIEISSDCTFCRSDLYYSARRDGPRQGRNVSIIRLYTI